MKESLFILGCQDVTESFVTATSNDRSEVLTNTITVYGAKLQSFARDLALPITRKDSSLSELEIAGFTSYISMKRIIGVIEQDAQRLSLHHHTGLAGKVKLIKI